jgi:hypothetical protein
MLKSTTLPAALLEAAQILSEAEKTLLTPIDNIQIAFDLEAGLATISAALPFTVSSPNASAIGIMPTDYAPVEDFDCASLGNLLDAGITSPSVAMAKIAAAINSAEAAKQAAGETPDGVGVGLNGDFDTEVLSVTASLPIVVTLDGSGKAVISVSNYIA